MIAEDAPDLGPEIEVEEEIEETETEEIEVEAKREEGIDRIQDQNHVPDLTRVVIEMSKKRKSVHTMTTEIEIIAGTAETVVETAVVIEIAVETAAEIVETANAMIAGVEEVVHHVRRVRIVKEVLVAKAQKVIRDLIVLKRALKNLPMLLANRNSFR